MKIERKNNFDLIRLIAAFQVAILHLNGHLEINSPGVWWNVFLKCIRPFPGVPIFFTISGFLIFASYHNNQSAKKYFTNRFLRIYPLIYVITIITATLLIIFAPAGIPFKKLIAWFFGQISIFQYYTPEALRYFGVGTPNGALWTIPVEIEFYLLVPVLYWLYKKFGNKILIIIAAACFCFYSYIPVSPLPVMYQKLFQTSVLYYLLHFIIGIFLYLYFNEIKKYILNRGLLWLGLYLIFYVCFDVKLGLYHDLYQPNAIGIIAVLLLALAILSLAYTQQNISFVLLKGNDYSYGVYVIHMVVGNVLIEMNYIKDFYYLIIALAITFFMAVISWRFIEKPALSMKKS